VKEVGMHPRVLVIEDNENNRELARFLLEQAGCRVGMAENGRQGLEMAAQERPDIILMDIQMPEMDGYEAVARLRQDPATSAIPIVGVSSYAMPDDKEKAMASGSRVYRENPRSGEVREQVMAFLRGGGGSGCASDASTTNRTTVFLESVFQAMGHEVISAANARRGSNGSRDARSTSSSPTFHAPDGWVPILPRGAQPSRFDDAPSSLHLHLHREERPRVRPELGADRYILKLRNPPSSWPSRTMSSRNASGQAGANAGSPESEEAYLKLTARAWWRNSSKKVAALEQTTAELQSALAAKDEEMNRRLLLEEELAASAEDGGGGSPGGGRGPRLQQHPPIGVGPGGVAVARRSLGRGGPGVDGPDRGA
jgi:two-component system cell cycle response regulator DivK